MRALLAILTLAAAFCFALDITMPLVEVKRLVFLTDRPSLLAIVAGLWAESDYALATVVAVFSIVFPAAKLVGMQLAAQGEQLPLAGRWLKLIARWSMLDVLLVALLVFAAKSSGLATAMSLPGLWFFAASVLLTAVASALAR